MLGAGVQTPVKETTLKRPGGFFNRPGLKDPEAGPVCQIFLWHKGGTFLQKFSIMHDTSRDWTTRVGLTPQDM